MLCLRIVFTAFLLFIATNAQKKDELKEGLEKKKTDVSGSAISCYQCNSPKNGTCAKSDNEEERENLKEFIKPCKPFVNGTETLQAKMCRKIVQNVEFIREKKTVEETRIIRECAYTDEKLDGKKRTGNKGIILYLYQCQNENNEPCNASNALSYSIMSVVASLFCFILRSQI